jgi:hypothetical protein
VTLGVILGKMEAEAIFGPTESLPNQGTEHPRTNTKMQAKRIRSHSKDLLTDWGLCGLGDAPAAIGGGSNAFHWFESETRLFDFVERHHPGPANLDHDLVASAVTKIIAQGAVPDHWTRMPRCYF